MLKQNYSGFLLECGLDEAGRGSLSGPVYAAAVILSPEIIIEGLDDSKKLTAKKRYLLREQIIEKSLAWAVASVDNEEIDKINILNASIKAMHLSIDKLKIKPEYLIVDGNKFLKYKQIPYKTIVKGDSKYMSIAAASILAKTFRDDYMIKVDEDFPEYNWKKNKGYATKEHREMVMKYGLTGLHRKNFCKFYFQKKINFGINK